MSKHLELGRKGENIAQDYLISLGYTIIERNWRIKNLEIDIITQKDDVVSFIEVKTRNNPIKDPLESVNIIKQKNLIRAANQFIQTNNMDHEIQFDIITISLHKGRFEIKHIKDAFYPF